MHTRGHQSKVVKDSIMTKGTDVIDAAVRIGPVSMKAEFARTVLEMLQELQHW